METGPCSGFSAVDFYRPSRELEEKPLMNREKNIGDICGCIIVYKQIVSVFLLLQ